MLSFIARVCNGRCFFNIFFSKVNIWDVNCAQGIAFIFDTRTDVLVKGSNHKFHSAAYKYNKMHNFVTEMCTHVHISVTKWCIVGFVILVDSTTVATCSSIIYIYIYSTIPRINMIMSLWWPDDAILWEPVHQQAWYWPGFFRIFRAHRWKG